MDNRYYFCKNVPTNHGPLHVAVCTDGTFPDGLNRALTAEAKARGIVVCLDFSYQPIERDEYLRIRGINPQPPQRHLRLAQTL